MRRRDFITLLGRAAATWPITARAQPSGMPMVGVLTISSASAAVTRVAAFKEGLSETGYVDGRNVRIEYRFTAGQIDQLPALAADLVRLQASVILAGGPPSVLALKAQTSTIPIVFTVGEDPVEEGLVVSLNRPEANITGLSTFANELFPKRLQLLNEIVPRSAPFSLLVNPNNPNAQPDTKAAEAAAIALGRELMVLPASTEAAVEAAFVAMVERRVGGLIVGVDGFFVDVREMVFALAARYAIPAIFDRRDFPAAGGLMSYSTSDREAYRQSGIYVGRILKGAKPADLPVMRATKFEFVINLKTAKELSLAFPPGLLAIADEVIE
jgi:putative ABC transport system substrate-binding protein